MGAQAAAAAAGAGALGAASAAAAAASAAAGAAAAAAAAASGKYTFPIAHTDRYAPYHRASRTSAGSIPQCNFGVNAAVIFSAGCLQTRALQDVFFT